MWSAFAVAAAAWAAVVVVATRELAHLDPPQPPPTVPVAEPPPTPHPPVTPPTDSGDVVLGYQDPRFRRIAGDVPGQLLERGNASLALRLRSTPGGEPVAMSVRLWRLGVAETDAWTSGDEIRA